MVQTKWFFIATGALALNAGIGSGQPEAPAPPVPMPAVLRDYQPVTAERLKNPEDGNWLSIRRTYNGWGYSPLDQITAENVKGLQPVWIFSTGEPKVHESAPLVNNGVMFISTPNNQVIAIDVRTGNLLWRYKRSRPAGAVVAHETSRGVALYGDKVYFAAGEAVLVALDARTGKEVWTTRRSGQQGRLLHHSGSADRRRQSHGGRIRRRVRNSRLRGRLRSRNRQGAMAHVHHTRARGTWQRNLAQRRPVEDRRRIGVGYRQLRPRYQSRLLGRRQRRSLDGRQTSRRQSVRFLDARIWMSPPAQSRAISSTIRTTPGIGTKCRRLSWWISSATGAPSKD